MDEKEGDCPNMKTKRLILRELDAGDVQQIVALAGDWDVARMTSRIPYPYSAAQAQHWINGLEPDEFVRVIQYNGALIGMCGYTLLEDGTAEIGYWIGKPWWGQGFATEATDHLVRYCLRATRVAKLTCCHFADNARSARVIEKLGFKRIGPCMAYCEARREDVETVTYERRRSVIEKFWRRAA
jgi:[ribosomal protein S5]-alanine N-acetyltransferase